MTVKIFSNPKTLIKELFNQCIYYEFLTEAKQSLGCQKLSKHFEGKSTRGGNSNSISAVTIENWIKTFEYVQENPNEEDKDLFQPRNISPKDSWFEYINLLKTPINEDEIKSWDNLSNKKLGDKAQDIGYIVGIRNSTAIKTLKERMITTVERRREHIWTKLDEFNELIPTICNFIYNQDISDTDYRIMNVNKLHFLCKQRKIVSMHKKKDEMIKLLEEYDSKEPETSISEYTKLSLIQLKCLAKERYLSDYNNKKIHELIQMLENYDENQKIKNKKKEEHEKNKYNMVLGDIVILARKQDNYIDATSLCKAAGKNFFNWNENSKSKEFLRELNRSIGNPMDLIKIISTGINEGRGTWVHPRVAINIAQWASPKFDVIVSGWIHNLLKDGVVSIGKPVDGFSTYTQIEEEAIYLENNLDRAKFSNCMVLYLSYIGDGLIKIGYSDCGFSNRNIRHMSCETKYKQFRNIGLYEISERSIEKLVHNNFIIYRYPFEKQTEIYSVKSLSKFTTEVEQFLYDNDLKMRIKELRKENVKMKIENAELKLKLKN